jgi:type IV pilus assembly protein PilE
MSRNISTARWRRDSGFTLIELMIVIVIVAVLMGIALPAYQDQIRRGHRAAAKAEMMEIASRQEQYLLANRSYVGGVADVEATGITEFSYTLPADVATRYTFGLSTSGGLGAPYFTISALPKLNGPQAADGPDALTLDSEGAKTPEDKWAR